MIRLAKIDDLDMAASVVGAFSAEIGRRFILERFVEFFAAVIEAGIGALILLEKDGAVEGVIGGLATPDPYHGGMVASELFWYVRESARGGLGSGRLYSAFEQWAIEKGCEEIQMVHLQQSMPDRLEAFYRGQGYQKLETRYIKNLEAAA